MEVRGRTFTWGARTYLVGIINVTPDSFAGDGVGADIAAAVARARRFELEGADVIDIGGESTRPGAKPVGEEEEARRVVPAILAVREVTELPLSVDTAHAAVAEAALAAGADIVNDTSGLRGDPAMAGAIARTGAALIAMHNQRGRQFRDVAGDILAAFGESLAIADKAGIAPGRVILDPGFGFGWTPEQNLEMLRRLPELWVAEMPLLVGPSRKSTLGLVLEAPVEERLYGTAAAVALAIAGGADLVRVHDVGAMAQVARVADAIVRANWRQP
jgi:dihydropteroate synthase